MSRIRFATARDVFDAFPAARDDITAAPNDDAPLAYLRQLLASETPENAIAFCAYIMPRRVAVSWACWCVRDLQPAFTAAEQEALLAAQDWVNEPEEDRRRAALRVGTDGARASPPTWLALAAGWSGGSMLPADQPPAPAPPHLTAKAVRTAVLTALAKVPSKQRRERLDLCIREAVRLSSTESEPARRPTVETER